MQDYLLLKKIIKELNKGKALDIGAGDGNKSQILNDSGFEVLALEKNRELIKKINERDIDSVCTDVLTFEFPPNEYALILASASLDFLDRAEKEDILAKSFSSLKEKGNLVLFVFSKKDPLYQVAKSRWKEVRKETFEFPETAKLHGEYINYLDREEWKELLKTAGFKSIQIKEESIEDAHPTPHQHYIFQITAKK